MHPVRRTQRRETAKLRRMVFIVASSILCSRRLGLYLDAHAIDQVVRWTCHDGITLRNSTRDLDGVAEIASERNLLESNLAFVRYDGDLGTGSLIENCSRGNDQRRHRR